MTLESLNAPACPVCGERMSLKVARQGRRAGNSFWGCPRFPACQGLLDLAHGFDEPSAEEAPSALHDPDAGPLRLRVGGFVWTYDRALLGKLVDLSPGRARVRIVHSAAHREEREYDPGQLDRAFLSPQTRVYVFDETREAWSAGRVIDYDRAAGEDELGYIVRRPGRDDASILERDLDARCFAPTVDPTDVLATGGIESQFFADQRLAVLRAIAETRSATAGSEGLLSASVMLLPHQVEVVRRVLSDPLQRYLLADEVGLGKTIEAGAILRQILNDLPEARALVVAPRTLIWQWERELREKFDISVDDRQVELATPQELPRILDRAHEFEVLIVDEAHHLVGRGGPSIAEL